MADSGKPLAIFLMGPTAAGKTDLALALRERLPCDIISVDSAMIYRGMDIGTAKPDADTLARAPHRLINILDPAERYSVARFRQDALREMATITAQGRIPLLVGGTMLYYQALQRGLSDLPVADEVVRRRLEQEAAALGWGALHQRLAKIDPEAAEHIHPNDPQRLQRALEVYEVSGRPMSQLWRQSGAHQKLPYTVAKLVVAPNDRRALHQRITQRFEQMLERGFLAEVERLHARDDLDQSKSSMRCVGYRQAWQYLSGELDYQTMREHAIIATRQFAKRQYTWLRNERDASWLDSLNTDLIDQTMGIVTTDVTHQYEEKQGILPDL